MNFPLVDSHCHLDHYHDLSEVMERAREASVSTLLSIGTSRKDFYRVLAIAEAHSHVYACVGLHPLGIQEKDTDGLLEWLVDCTRHPKVVGIGETGFDASSGDPLLQETLFRIHVEAALQTQLPLVVHTRRSDEIFLSVLEGMSVRPRGVLHCFTGGLACAKQAVAWGWKISFSGILTFPNGQDVREVAQNLPLESLLVETDAPWLAPQKYRGRRNEPAYVRETARQLAELHSTSLEEMANQTTKNFFSLFTKITA